MSLRALRGRILMTFRAGLAWKICSCLVKGLMPLRFGVAGLAMTMIFSRPGKAKTPGPFLPTAALIWPERASNMDTTCLRESCVASAMLDRISLFVAGLALFAILLLLRRLEAQKRSSMTPVSYGGMLPGARY